MTKQLSNVTAGLTIFENSEFGPVRIIIKANGELLFCQKDVNKCLGCGESTKDTRVNMATSESSSCALFINESELHSLTLKAAPDLVKKFRRWVTNDVLPTVREMM